MIKLVIDVVLFSSMFAFVTGIVLALFRRPRRFFLPIGERGDFDAALPPTLANFFAAGWYAVPH